MTSEFNEPAGKPFSGIKNLFPPEFYVIALAFYIAGAALLLLFDKGSLHLMINKFHSPFSDFVFRWITNLGDGLAAVIAAVIFLNSKNKHGLLIGLSSLLSGLFTQLLKHSWFSGMVRPSKYFAASDILYKVPGVELFSFNSFPSGHSATIFSICLALSIIIKKRAWRIVFASAALLVAFSRVYLSQHFFMDIYFGSMLGIASVYISYFLLDLWERKGAAWLDRPLFGKKLI